MLCFKLSVLVLLGLMLVAGVFGQYGGGRYSGRGRGMSYGNGKSSMGGRGSMGGRRGAVGGGYSNGRGGGGRRYRSTLFNDDDIYGYEANYPGGEALYVNYRNSEARTRRAQEFARSSPYSSDGQDFSGMQFDQFGRGQRSAEYSQYEQPQW